MAIVIFQYIQENYISVLLSCINLNYNIQMCFKINIEQANYSNFRSEESIFC